MRGEMGQLVETNQRDLRALPVVNGGVELQMRKLDLASARPAPLACTEMRDPAEPRIKILALIPQSTGIGDLRRRAPEKDRGEVGDPADMTQRLEDQADGLPATRAAAVDADVGGGLQKLGLRAGLRGDRRCER
jgi:hypothetical protein